MKTWLEHSCCEMESYDTQYCKDEKSRFHTYALLRVVAIQST